MVVRGIIIIYRRCVVVTLQMCVVYAPKGSNVELNLNSNVFAFENQIF